MIDNFLVVGVGGLGLGGVLTKWKFEEFHPIDHSGCGGGGQENENE